MAIPLSTSVVPNPHCPDFASWVSPGGQTCVNELDPARFLCNKMHDLVNGRERRLFEIQENIYTMPEIGRQY